MLSNHIALLSTSVYKLNVKKDFPKKGKLQILIKSSKFSNSLMSLTLYNVLDWSLRFDRSYRLGLNYKDHKKRKQFEIIVEGYYCKESRLEQKDIRQLFVVRFDHTYSSKQHWNRGPNGIRDDFTLYKVTKQHWNRGPNGILDYVVFFSVIKEIVNFLTYAFYVLILYAIFSVHVSVSTV